MDDEPQEMLAAGLAGLREAAGLEGAAIVDLADPAKPLVVQQAGFGGATAITTAGILFRRDRAPVAHGMTADRRPVLVCGWQGMAGPAGLVMWRAPGSRAWAAGDQTLAQASGALVRVMLDLGPGEATLDRMTHLPNRAYFLEEVDRHIDRLDLDGAGGSMLLIDIDGMARVNASHGRGAGDRLLVRMANLLRAMVRPTDLVGRVGGDEFAVWMDGMDHMTAAERADALGQRRLLIGEPDDALAPRLSFSIGIASRLIGNGEGARTLLRRAHAALHEVKAIGGGGWRVAQPVDPSKG